MKKIPTTAGFSWIGRTRKNANVFQDFNEDFISKIRSTFSTSFCSKLEQNRNVVHFWTVTLKAVGYMEKSKASKVSDTWTVRIGS